MAIKAADIIRGGGLRMICQEFNRLGGRPSDWRAVRLFASREFRGASKSVISQVIKAAQKAAKAAKVFNASDENELPNLRFAIGREGEKKCSAMP
jgi:hypothetical protein